MSNSGMVTLKARFEEKFIPEPNSGCWLWDSSYASSGYGQIYLQRRMVLAHRASWRLHFGDIPSGLCVLHKCDVKECVNPDHLFLGSHAENMRDMVKKGRQVTWNRGITHCKRGHEYTEENTLWVKSGTERWCRTCKSDYYKRWNARPENKAKRAARWAKYAPMRRANLAKART